MGNRRRPGGRELRSHLGLLLIAAAALVLLIPAAAAAVFPGSNPAESPRANPPNDPDFDACESDDPDPAPACDTYFEEEFRAFGFSPDSANFVPVNGSQAHYLTGTKYADCSQLDAQGKAANVAAENPPPGSEPLAECLQIAGVRADTAFKYSTGDPDVAVAILDRARARPPKRGIYQAAAAPCHVEGVRAPRT